MLLHLVIRLLLILTGYGLASLASGIVVATVFYVSEGDPHMEYLGLVGLVTVLIAMYAALPAAIAVVLAEALSWRWRLYYIAVACVIGMGLPLFVGLHWGYVLLGLGFGPVAGMIYWLLAGRRAGWRPSPASLP